MQNEINGGDVQKWSGFCVTSCR